MRIYTAYISVFEAECEHDRRAIRLENLQESRAPIVYVASVITRDIKEKPKLAGPQAKSYVCSTMLLWSLLL